MELDLFNNNNGKQSSSFAPQVQSELFTVIGEGLNTYWKAGVKLGELENNTVFLLFKENDIRDGDSAIIGGEIFAELNGGKYLDHHNISLSSTGSRSFIGASDSDEKFTIVKCWYKNTPYYGIKFQVTDGEKIEVNPKVFRTRNKEAGASSDGVDCRVKYTSADRDLLFFSLGDGAAANDIHSTQTIDGVSYESPHGNWAWITFDDLFKFVRSENGSMSAMKLTDSGSSKYLSNSAYYNQVTEKWFFLCDVSNTGIKGVYMAKELVFEEQEDGTYDVPNKFDLTMDSSEDETTVDLSSGPLFTFVENHSSTPSATTYGTSGGTSGDRWSKLFDYQEKIAESYKIGDSQDIPIYDVKIYFNGWIKIPTKLKPPASYTDDSFPRIVPLAEEASQSTADSTISDVVSGSTEGVSGVPEGVGGETGNLGNIENQAVADKVLDNVITTFPAVGVDKDPNTLRFRETDVLTKVVLLALAKSLRDDPSTQIIVDLQRAQVDPDYDVWDDDLFHDCHRLRGIILPKDIRGINGPIFRGCYFLRYIDFSQTKIETIAGGNKYNTGQYSFFEGTRIFNVIFPETLTYINKKVFERSSVRHVYFKNKNQLSGGSSIATGNDVGEEQSFSYEDWTNWIQLYLPESTRVLKYGNNIRNNLGKHVSIYDPDNFDFSSVDTSFYS